MNTRNYFRENQTELENFLEINSVIVNYADTGDDGSLEFLLHEIKTSSL